LAAIRKQKPPLTYFPIRDRFEAKMRDWCSNDPGFPNSLQPLLESIRESGCEFVIWLAAFSAAKDSEILREHADWFVCDQAG
jgi:alpha-galactosidase